MQVTTELSPMFSYSLIPIIIFTIILICIITLIIYRNKNNNKNIPIQVSTPNKNNIQQIKRKYLFKIDNLLNEFNNKIINNRQAYQRLSNLIRNFIYETTNIKVQNYTLNDIKKINLPILAELIEEYYNPEFSKISNGNIINSIEKTRKVIEKWN